MPASRALRASSGPASASASTLTITMCLPCRQHASTWAMPAAGEPVASITTSTASLAITAGVSSVRQVPPLRWASSRVFAPSRSSPQPTDSSAAFARAGLRSDTATKCSPGVRRTWLRNMEPNLPAPIRATRSGRPSAARWASIA